MHCGPPTIYNHIAFAFLLLGNPAFYIQLFYTEKNLVLSFGAAYSQLYSKRNPQGKNFSNCENIIIWLNIEL